MADYTPNYGLHQWEASDSFLRTDFNQDFSKIDAALGRAERSAQANAYNLYNLMLQNYYESKYTGYKKALIFDGFLDDEGIASITPGAWLDTANGRVELITTGAQEIVPATAKAEVGETNTDGTVQYQLTANYPSVSVPITPSGYGTLNKVTLRLASKGTSYPENIRVQLRDGDTVLGTSNTITVAKDSYDDYELTFSPGIPVEARRTYDLWVELLAGKQCIYVVLESWVGSFRKIYAKCVFTPDDYTQGTVTGETAELEGRPQRVLAWARHSGGDVGMELLTGGTACPMTVSDSHQALTLQGTPCTETAYVLDHPPGLSGGVAARITLTAGSDTCFLYDYGLVFL